MRTAVCCSGTRTVSDAGQSAWAWSGLADPAGLAAVVLHPGLVRVALPLLGPPDTHHVCVCAVPVVHPGLGREPAPTRGRLSGLTAVSLATPALSCARPVCCGYLTGLNGELQALQQAGGRACTLLGVRLAVISKRTAFEAGRGLETTRALSTGACAAGSRKEQRSTSHRHMPSSSNARPCARTLYNGILSPRAALRRPAVDVPACSEI